MSDYARLVIYYSFRQEICCRKCSNGYIFRLNTKIKRTDKIFYLFFVTLNLKNQNVCFSFLTLHFTNSRMWLILPPWRKMILRSIGKYIHTANKHILTIIEHQISKKEDFPENLEKYFHNFSQIRNSFRDLMNIWLYFVFDFCDPKPYDKKYSIAQLL